MVSIGKRIMRIPNVVQRMILWHFRNYLAILRAYRPHAVRPSGLGKRKLHLLTCLWNCDWWQFAFTHTVSLILLCQNTKTRSKNLLKQRRSPGKLIWLYNDNSDFTLHAKISMQQQVDTSTAVDLSRYCMCKQLKAMTQFHRTPNNIHSWKFLPLSMQRFRWLEEVKNIIKGNTCIFLHSKKNQILTSLLCAVEMRVE